MNLEAAYGVHHGGKEKGYRRVRPPRHRKADKAGKTVIPNKYLTLVGETGSMLFIPSTGKAKEQLTLIDDDMPPSG
jgi:hypothetical protein